MPTPNPRQPPTKDAGHAPVAGADQKEASEDETLQARARAATIGTEELGIAIRGLKTLQARARVSGQAVPNEVLELDELCIQRDEARSIPPDCDGSLTCCARAHHAGCPGIRTAAAEWFREGGAAAEPIPALRNEKIGSAPDLVRVVVAVDPAFGGGDEIGIGAVGIDRSDRLFVLEDATLPGDASPLVWGAAVGELYDNPALLAEEAKGEEKTRGLDQILAQTDGPITDPTEVLETWKFGDADGDPDEHC